MPRSFSLGLQSRLFEFSDARVILSVAFYLYYFLRLRIDECDHLFSRPLCVLFFCSSLFLNLLIAFVKSGDYIRSLLLLCFLLRFNQRFHLLLAFISRFFYCRGEVSWCDRWDQLKNKTCRLQLQILQKKKKNPNSVGFFDGQHINETPNLKLSRQLILFYS